MLYASVGPEGQGDRIRLSVEGLGEQNQQVVRGE